MSKIAEFRAAELALGKQLAAFEALKNDHALKRELEFDAALTRLLADYNLDRNSLVSILGLTGSKANVAANSEPREKRVYKKREAPKTFRNPHTGETLTVKRLTHSSYKAWVEQYGEVVVHTWLVE